jgi:hypothetical protein
MPLIVFSQSFGKTDVRAALPQKYLNVFQYPEFADFVKPITKPSAFSLFWVVFEVPSQDSA